MMNYEESLYKIHGYRRFGAVPDLKRIRNLLDGLGSPEKHLRFIHIAGTNGKGSTAAFCESALRLKGIKTGLFTSPYLEDFRERIQITGEPIEKEDLAVYAEPVLRLAETAKDKPTEFDVVTAVALSYFAACAVDIVVLEVGLGGRYDPTNCIPVPDAAVITRIALDHTQQLGDTVEKIAWEKAGIIKRGGTIILSGNQDEKAVQVIKTECENNNARLTITQDPEIIHSGADGSGFVYKNTVYETDLIGRHQIQNAATAIETLKALNLNETEIARGIKAARWKGRLELISKDPPILIDAAHNPDGIQALIDTLDNILKPEKVITIMSIMQDKDWRQCAELTAKKSSSFFAVPTGSPRSIDPETLAEFAKTFCPNTVSFESVEEAYAAAKPLCGKNDLIVICGSVVLAGLARTYLTKLT